MEETKETEGLKERIVQTPLTEAYMAKLEAEASANDRTMARHSAWIVKRYFDGTLVPTFPLMAVAAEK